jgi:uncharacterized SAM-binding protein YcdF (DUF218 family)
MYIISIPFPSVIISYNWGMADTFRSDIKYDAVVVLTGVCNLADYFCRQNKPEMWQDYFRASESVDRLIAGIYFIKNKNADVLLFGNAVYNSVSEAEQVKKYALACGLHERQFKIYGKVQRTSDEAKGVRSYAERNSIKKILLVTSENHMIRAYALFKKQGLTVDTFSVQKHYLKIGIRSFIPSFDGVQNLTRCLYELFGYVGYYIKGDL